MEIRCKALHRKINVNHCALSQKELPKKFCIGCEWQSDVIVELTSQQKRKSRSYEASTYKIIISNKLKEILSVEAKKRGLKINVYIAKVLAKAFLK